MPTVFIGSSSERIEVAEAVEVNLADFLDVASWKHAFRPGRAFLTDLIALANRCGFAVLILTPDDVLRSRGNEYNSPRDNVLFELGLFVGVLGPERVFVLVDSSIDTKILSDYSGITTLSYNGSRPNQDLVHAVRAACIKIKSIVTSLSSRFGSLIGKETKPEHNLSAIGVKRIYETFRAAEADILAAMKKSTGPIRLFFQIASQDINARGSLFDSLSEIVERSGVEIQVLHAGLNSPLFSRDRLIALGKNPDSIIRSLKHVDESLAHLELIPNSSLRRRTHDHPFIWRMYGFGTSLYLMPYFSEKDAVAKSPVIVFEKSPTSLYQSFVDWFDYTWSKCAPAAVFLDEIITPATPCGTALFLNWNEFHVFGIPKRDVIEGSEHVRFYGIGGKRRNSEEPLEECGLREGNEECGGAVRRLLTSTATDRFRSNGVIEKIDLQSNGIKPRLLYEKREHTGLGAMKPEDDHYYMVGYQAELLHRPAPSGEIAALLFATDRHLEIISRRNDVTIGQLVMAGAQLVEQHGISVKAEKILVPHGTASYLVRLRTR